MSLFSKPLLAKLIVIFLISFLATRAYLVGQSLVDELNLVHEELHLIAQSIDGVNTRLQHVEVTLSELKTPCDLALQKHTYIRSDSLCPKQP